MPTRSYIGRLMNDGSVQAVYCHWDGKPSRVGEILFKNYGLNNIDRLLMGGGIENLKSTPEETEYQEKVDKVEFKDIKDFSEQGQEFNYLLLTTDRWFVHNRREYPNWIDLQLAISDYLGEDE